MTKDLTKLALDNLKPGPTRREVPDGHTRGLYFVLQPSGKSSWALRYRFAGKPKKLTLGPYPEIEMKVARELARKALAKVAAGGDPAAEKQTAKAAARTSTDHDLVENVVSAFIERYAKRETREKTWRETERLLTREVVGKWRGRRLSEIKRADIHNLLDRIADRPAPVVAVKTLQRCAAWAIGLPNAG